MKAAEFTLGGTAAVRFPKSKRWPRLGGKCALGTVTRINRKSVTIAGTYDGVTFNVLRPDDTDVAR